MINGCSDNRQSQGDIDPIVEMEQFQGDETLIVVHADHRIILTLNGKMKERISR